MLNTLRIETDDPLPFNACSGFHIMREPCKYYCGAGGRQRKCAHALNSNLIQRQWFFKLARMRMFRLAMQDSRKPPYLLD